MFSPKAIIKNEYGIKIGKLELSKPGAQKGFLEIEDKKYQYIFNENNNAELQVFEENKNEKLISCNFPVQDNKPAISTNSSFLDSKLPSLLLVLCWYAFQHNGLAIK